MYAFGPLSGAAVNVTLLSNCGTCCIGVNVDSVAVPDRDVLAELAEGASFRRGAWRRRPEEAGSGPGPGLTEPGSLRPRYPDAIGRRDAGRAARLPRPARRRRGRDRVRAPRSRTGSSESVGPVLRRTAPGSRRCSRSAGSASTPSPATSRRSARRVPPEGRRPRRPAVHALVRRAPRDAADRAQARLPVRHGLAGARREVEGRAAGRPARPRRRAAGGDGAAVHVLRRHVHREPHPRAGAPQRRDRRLRARRRASSPTTHGGPVRLYVAPMYGYKSIKWLDAIELDRRGRARATGKSSATTSTDGSAAPTDATTSHLTP